MEIGIPFVATTPFTVADENYSWGSSALSTASHSYDEALPRNFSSSVASSPNSFVGNFITDSPDSGKDSVDQEPLEYTPKLDVVGKSPRVFRVYSRIDYKEYKDEVRQLADAYRRILKNYNIEVFAMKHRNNAATTSNNLNMDLNSTEVMLRARITKIPSNVDDCNFSRKIFVGGLPPRTSLFDLCNHFGRYGNVEVLVPASSQRSIEISKGFCYLLFRDPESVKNLMSFCDNEDNNYFTQYKNKRIQVIPWRCSDSEYGIKKILKYGRSEPSIVKPGRNDNTVFVGALHGTITARCLFEIFCNLFGGANYAALDMDKHHYPVGSGRVTFVNEASYMKAVNAKLLMVEGPNFKKTLQIDPYLEDSMCSKCQKSPGVYFCRSTDCFQYYCPPCWQLTHKHAPSHHHQPIRRTFNNILVG